MNSKTKKNIIKIHFDYLKRLYFVVNLVIFQNRNVIYIHVKFCWYSSPPHYKFLRTAL